jgi:acetylglutamate kinase
VLDAEGRLIPQLSRERAQLLIREGVIKGGMIPKIECCAAAVNGGVARAHVVDGRVLHAVLLEVFTDGGVGTLITR